MLAPEDYPGFDPDVLHAARRRCECGAEVLAVTVNGSPVLVEVAEVLPLAPCSFCAAIASRGHERLKCQHCRMAGHTGELLPLRGVVLGEDGRARMWTRRYDSKVRRGGDAILRFHGPCTP